MENCRTVREEVLADRTGEQAVRVTAGRSGKKAGKDDCRQNWRIGSRNDRWQNLKAVSSEN
jgi:hypothetical protein